LISASIKWIGDVKFVGKMSKRGAGAALDRAVMKPWATEILRERIPSMFRAGGAVPGRGGQGRWARLTPSTIEKKGSDVVLLAAGSAAWRFGSLVRSYAIDVKRRGLRAFELTLTNRARSKPWRSASGEMVDDKFDYPSALHRGWEGYDVFPRPDNPTGLLSWRLADGDWVFADHTHPSGAPPRPHLLFHGPWTRKLFTAAARWILRGEPYR
jgi:hypothetical protein